MCQSLPMGLHAFLLQLVLILLNSNINFDVVNVLILNGLTVATSMNDKNEPPTKASNNVVTKRCIIQVEPLVLNDVVITPLQTKRRASHSIPEESNVTPKRSKLNSPGNKELKVSVLSLRQSFHKCTGQDYYNTKNNNNNSTDDINSNFSSMKYNG